MHRSPLVALLVTGLIAASCSGSVSFSIGGKSPEDATVELIEGELSDQIDVPLAAECPDLDDPEAGDTFECTGTTPDGQVIRFTVEIGEDEVFANSVNALTPEDVPGFEEAVVTALNDANDLDIPLDALDCGAGPLIVPPDRQFVCRLSDDATGEVYDTTITITDQADWTFSVDVAAEPS